MPGSIEPVADSAKSTDSAGLRTIAIIPAFNEEAALPAVLGELGQVAPDLEVVVVSDGSSDRTGEVARRAGVHVVELPYNLGIGGALQTGFRYAARHGYDRAIQFDADGQHDPAQIPTLLAALDGGADLVVGSRFASSESAYRVGRTRGGAMGVIRLGVRLLSGRQFTDTSSGFRGFSKGLIGFFADTYPPEYMDSVEALLLALRSGFAVVEVPVTMRERQAGTPSNRSLRLAYHFVRLAVVMVSGATRHRPLPREASQ
ncbi:MAG: glycosyltransferase family 2 protein [Acidimicrobiales bacterium]